MEELLFVDRHDAVMNGRVDRDGGRDEDLAHRRGHGRAVMVRTMVRPGHVFVTAGAIFSTLGAVLVPAGARLIRPMRSGHDSGFVIYPTDAYFSSRRLGGGDEEVHDGEQRQEATSVHFSVS